ncbi:MAG: CehA/McbA family metallohydrolase [Verrucomicrobia bacterium]|nr:CehA/McbA family metallohydrolase [Verrucomicrobiota bacterium]
MITRTLPLTVVARCVNGGIAESPRAHAQGYENRRFVPTSARRALPAGLLLYGFALFLLMTGTALAQFSTRSKYAGGQISQYGYMYNYYLPPTASTPWRPAWSPDGREIAFSMSGSLWKIKIGETTAHELTANKTYDSSPAWSPDGRWIVYTAEDGQGINLMLLNVASGDSTPVTQGDQLNVDPAWSPDGRTLAYVNNSSDGSFHLYTRVFENGRFGEATRITEPHSFGRPRLYFSPNDDHIQPTFSPDGREIILVSNRGITLGSGAIWRAPLGPDVMAKATRILREETLYRTRPKWSPDGKRILYASHRGSQFTNLYVYPVHDGEPLQLTRDDWDHFDPAWSPDGEWIAYISNQHGGSELRLLRTFGGTDEKVEIARRVHRRPMGKIEVFVHDAATGKPTPARIYMNASDGRTYAPASAFHRIAARAAKEDFFHAEGHFVVDVPVGELVLEAAKGTEFWPAQAKIKVAPDGVTRVVLELKRMTSMKALGWWSGSDHVHMNYGGNFRNTPEYMRFEAEAEDLDHIGWKIANKDNRVFDTQYYQGSPLHPLTDGQHLVSVGQEYRPAWYGHISFINLKKHLISPFTTAYEDTGIASLYPSNTDMFRLARQQGAIGGYVHPWTGEISMRSEYRGAQAYPVDAALGSFEYLEVMTNADRHAATSRVWHRSLNCGFKVTASAGEDSILNLQATPIIGSARLYAHLGSKLTWEGWLDAIRKGRTFVTNGPLLQLTIDGEMPGGEIRLPAAGGSVTVSAKLESIVPLETLELMFNGKVIESIPLGGDGRKAVFERKIAVTGSGWFTLRTAGRGIQHPIDDSFPVAETGAVYVYVGDRPIQSKADAEYFAKWIDDLTRLWSGYPYWRSDREKQHVLAQFAEARKVYERQIR